MVAIEFLEPRQLLSGVNGVPDAIIAVGQDRGSSANPSENMVEVYNARTQQRLYAFDPYADDPRYHGGTRVAVADVTGDGVADIVTAPGGGSLVRAFDGRDGQQLWSFRALEIGDDRALYVAAGDTDGDGTAEVIVSPDSGLGTVRVFDGTTPGLLRWKATPFPQVVSGARVAVGDTDGDGAAEVIVAGGEGAPPLVRVLADGGVLVHSFYAYKPSTRGGIYLAAGDADGDGKAEIAASAMANHVVRVFDGQATASNADGSTGLVERYLPAWDGDYSGGLRLAMVDVNSDGRDDLIATPHRLPGTPTDLRAYDVQTGTRLLDLDIFANWDNGAFTAGGTNANRGPTLPAGIQTISVPGTAAAGDVLGQLTASDPEGGTLSFALTTGNESDLFALSSAGVLTATTAPAGPTASSYTLGFTVTDGAGNTASGSAKVSVGADGSNAPPEIQWAKVHEETDDYGNSRYTLRGEALDWTKLPTWLAGDDGSWYGLHIDVNADGIFDPYGELGPADAYWGLSDYSTYGAHRPGYGGGPLGFDIPVSLATGQAGVTFRIVENRLDHATGVVTAYPTDWTFAPIGDPDTRNEPPDFGVYSQRLKVDAEHLTGTPFENATADDDGEVRYTLYEPGLLQTADDGSWLPSLTALSVDASGKVSVTNPDVLCAIMLQNNDGEYQFHLGVEDGSASATVSVTLWNYAPSITDTSFSVAKDAEPTPPAPPDGTAGTAGYGGGGPGGVGNPGGGGSGGGGGSNSNGVLGTLNLTQGDDDPLTWTVLDGVKPDEIAFNESDGTFTLVAPIDYETAPDLPGGGKGYQFTVKVTDGIAVDEAKVTINVTNVAPTAFIKPRVEGNTLVFDESYSTDPQGAALKYHYEVSGLQDEQCEEGEFLFDGPDSTIISATLYVTDGYDVSAVNMTVAVTETKLNDDLEIVGLKTADEQTTPILTAGVWQPEWDPSPSFPDPPLLPFLASFVRYSERYCLQLLREQVRHWNSIDYDLAAYFLNTFLSRKENPEGQVPKYNENDVIDFSNRAGVDHAFDLAIAEMDPVIRDAIRVNYRLPDDNGPTILRNHINGLDNRTPNQPDTLNFRWRTGEGLAAFYGVRIHTKILSTTWEENIDSIDYEVDVELTIKDTFNFGKTGDFNWRLEIPAYKAGHDLQAYYRYKIFDVQATRRHTFKGPTAIVT